MLTDPSSWVAWQWSIAAGLYLALGYTIFLPLAVLLGCLAQYGRKPTSDEYDAQYKEIVTDPPQLAVFAGLAWPIWLVGSVCFLVIPKLWWLTQPFREAAKAAWRNARRLRNPFRSLMVAPTPPVEEAVSSLLDSDYLHQLNELNRLIPDGPVSLPQSSDLARQLLAQAETRMRAAEQRMNEVAERVATMSHSVSNNGVLNGVTFRTGDRIQLHLPTGTVRVTPPTPTPPPAPPPRPDSGRGFDL